MFVDLCPLWMVHVKTTGTFSKSVVLAAFEVKGGLALTDINLVYATAIS